MTGTSLNEAYGGQGRFIYSAFADDGFTQQISSKLVGGGKKMRKRGSKRRGHRGRRSFRKSYRRSRNIFQL